MSDTKTATLNPDNAQTGTEMGVASNHCWPNNTISAHEYFLFNIGVDGANIVGAGIRTHGYEQVVVTTNYPDGQAWQLIVYNSEDHDVVFDVYAWWS